MDDGYPGGRVVAYHPSNPIPIPIPNPIPNPNPNPDPDPEQVYYDFGMMERVEPKAAL